MMRLAKVREVARVRATRKGPGENIMAGGRAGKRKTRRWRKGKKRERDIGQPRGKKPNLSANQGRIAASPRKRALLEIACETRGRGS